MANIRGSFLANNERQVAGRLGTVIGVTSLLRTIIKTLYIQGGPQKMQKLNEYPTTKSVNYEFIRDSTNLKNIQYCSTYN